MPARTRITLPADDFALSPEGVALSEELAAVAFENFTATVEIARLDTNITAVCLIAELLAGLEHYGGISVKNALASARRLVAPRITAFAEADRDAGAASHAPTMASASGATLH
jgi:hypothetical protein